MKLPAGWEGLSFKLDVEGRLIVSEVPKACSEHLAGSATYALNIHGVVKRVSANVFQVRHVFSWPRGHRMFIDHVSAASSRCIPCLVWRVEHTWLHRSPLRRCHTCPRRIV